MLAALILWLSAAWSVQHQPVFHDFAVQTRLVGSAVTPNVSSGRAHMFRTILRREGLKPPNFAGQYRVVTWGCGTCCNEFAIVNERSGNVFFPTFVVACKAPFESEYGGEVGIDFKIDSRLLIITGAKNEKGGGRYFYEWTGKRLKLLLALEPK
jgi:hypothetical protein